MKTFSNRYHNVLEVKWTKEAKTTFEDNVRYLRQKWSEKEVETFIARIKQVVALIERHPEMYSPSPAKPGVRKVKINKKIDLYYKHLPEIGQIHLLTF